MFIIDATLDFFFPRYCLMCNRPLEPDEKTICLDCNIGLPRTSLWFTPKDNHLAKRFYGKVVVDKVASYVYYYSHSHTADIVYAFKYHNEPYTAVSMGRFMGLEIGMTDFFNDIDCLIPVPLNKKRLRQRGYNQSERLAHGISKVTGIEVVNKAIIRKVYTVSQTQMDAYERQDNMDNVFALTKHADKIKGKHCLLIDDVITTGAITAACARTLLQVSDVKVSILSFGCVKHIE